jgi:hypothetical protein
MNSDHMKNRKHTISTTSEFPWWRQAAARAMLSSVVIVFGGLLVSCGDGAVAAKDANPQVVFDGTSCTYDGPAEITEGGIEFTLINQSTTDINLFVMRFDDPADFEAEIASLAVGADTDEVASGVSRIQ